MIGGFIGKPIGAPIPSIIIITILTVAGGSPAGNIVPSPASGSIRALSVSGGG